MRMIKFRGKRIDNGMWIEGDLKTSLTPKGSMVRKPAICTIEGTIGTFFVVPETIGQFTGRLDRNNKEVYEGDIVVIYYQNDKSCIGRVIFCDMAFCVKTKENVIFNSGDFYGIEIIGNIYDNPEFLK